MNRARRKLRQLRRPNRRTDPLRRIVRRELHDGRPFVLLVCHHTSPGVPAARFAKFYPCIYCADLVEKVRAERRAP